MASLYVHFSPLFLGISISLFISLFFSISPVHSLTCTSQKLSDNRTYANCADLPTLGATLHSTYTAANRSFAVAFVAKPPSPTGWVGWGINPSGGGMQGSGALIAFKLNDKITVNTYNLTSYKFINQTNKLSFEMSDFTAVDVGGEITIFAVVKLPEKADNLSQVWQVGPVTNGMPVAHAFEKENLGSRAGLQVAGTATATAPSGSESGGGGGNSTGSGDKSGGAVAMGERFGLGFYLGLFLVLVGFMSM